MSTPRTRITKTTSTAKKVTKKPAGGGEEKPAARAKTSAKAEEAASSKTKKSGSVALKAVAKAKAKSKTRSASADTSAKPAKSADSKKALLAKILKKRAETGEEAGAPAKKRSSATSKKAAAAAAPALSAAAARAMAARAAAAQAQDAAKRSKCPYKKSEIAELRDMLVSKRESLRRHIAFVDSMNEEERSGNRSFSNHQADAASDSASLETLLRQRREHEELLVLVLEALERMDRGTYGICIRCGHWIPMGRLHAKPWAKLCVKCKEELEKARLG
ncbi:MAG: TraR/DksA C4-type zinc finger protein [Sumerlaeia bacterium]